MITDEALYDFWAIKHELTKKQYGDASEEPC